MHGRKPHMNTTPDRPGSVTDWLTSYRQRGESKSNFNDDTPYAASSVKDDRAIPLQVEESSEPQFNNSLSGYPDKVKQRPNP
jgi:hypothetical protein